MAATVLLPATRAILDGLMPLVTQQINLTWGFKKDLIKLQRRLENIQALLLEAEKGQIVTETLKKWLKSLKRVACDAENVLGELAYEALRWKLEERKRDQVRNFFSPSNPLAFRLSMANRVNDINLLLDEIYKEAKEMGLQPAQQLASASAFVSPGVGGPTIAYVDKSGCVGRAGDVEAVRDMLLDSKDDLSVVAIVGMPGVGKTTLAQLLYQDEKVVEYFGENRMWICVSDDFKVARLLNEMVESLCGMTSVTNIGGIVRKLEEKLRENKYLLVLDDVWNTNQKDWDDMRNSLKSIGDSNKSKIVVTTRSEVVVSTMRVPQSLTHPLCELSPEDSWAMFRKKAFAIGGPKETKSLAKIGKRMLIKCKGVPLAISSLGGLLHGKKSHVEWVSIEEGELWRSVKDGEILPVLRLSFHHLPSNLKQCFAYCSIFPKDHVLQKDNLIQLWASLGYLQCRQEGDLEMEDLGNEYFNILLRNSLFQNAVFDEYNSVIACKMHDLVHELALDVSEGSCLTLEGSRVKDYPEVQHLSLCLKEETRLEISDKTIGKLRTLFLTGNFPKNTNDVKSIRALSIEKSSVKELSRSICMYIHLKYLDISKSSFEKVPSFITKLYNLETLRLPPYSNLEEIQTELHKLVNLRHLCVQGTTISTKFIPSMIGHLTSLRTLPFFSVGEDEGHKIEELGSLSKLRGRLHVYNLQHVKNKDEAERAKMSGKSRITELEFHWGRNLGMLDINYEDVLEGLAPHENLKSLILRYFGGQRLASWMRSRDDQLLQNLVKMELIGCELCEIPILGHLPHLEIVKMVALNNMESIGPEFYGLDKRIVGGSSSNVDATAPVVFPALRQLTICGMRKLKEWLDISSLPPAITSIVEFFPRLEELYISECPNLITIPGHLSSIQDLYITSSKYHTRREIVYRPFLTIEVDGDSKNIGILMEHLLQTSSKSLRHLQISNLHELRHLSKQLLNLPSLEALHISSCPKLMHIGEETRAEFNRLTSLQEISIQSCNELTCLAKGLLQPALVRLKIADCDNLTLSCSTLMDPYELPNLSSLQELSISWCSKLTCFPKGLLQPTLVSLEISRCPNLMEANPDELRNLTSLEELVLVRPNSGWVRSWKVGQFCLTSLQTLDFEGDYLPWPEVEMADPQNPQHYPFMSLEYLVLRGGTRLECLSDQLRHLTSLRELEFTNFRGFEVLPVWLGNLSSLESLTIRWCQNLKSLPSPETFQLLKNLQSLKIIGCSRALKERCEEGGEEWNKIAHIPKLSIHCIHDYV